MKTQTMYTVALLTMCFSLVACGTKGGGEAAPSDSPAPKLPISAPGPTTTIVIIKNSVLGDIAAYTAPGLSTDLKLECNVSSGIVYCNALTVIP